MALCFVLVLLLRVGTPLLAVISSIGICQFHMVCPTRCESDLYVPCAVFFLIFTHGFSGASGWLPTGIL